MTAPTFQLRPFAAAVLPTLFLAANIPLTGQGQISVTALKVLLPGWKSEFFEEAASDHLRLVLGVLLVAFSWPAGRLPLLVAFFRGFVPPFSLSLLHLSPPFLFVMVMLRRALGLFQNLKCIIWFPFYLLACHIVAMLFLIWLRVWHLALTATLEG